MKSKNDQPFHFIWNPILHPYWADNYIKTLLPKQPEQNLALVPYKPTLGEEIAKKFAELNKIPVQNVVGAEKKCESLHKEILRNYLKQLVIENKVQNVKVFDENISDCAYEGEQQNRIDAILTFNGEKCHVALTFDKVNGLSQYNILNEKQIGDKFLINKNNTYNCYRRIGTDQVIHSAKDF